MTLELRGYQQEAGDAMRDAWSRGVQRPVLVLPTGTGKTVVMAGIIKQYLDDNPGSGVLVLAHRGELLEQIIKTCSWAMPDVSTGIVMASRREYEATIVAASVQTLAGNQTHKQELGERGLILCDEAHHFAARSFRETLKLYGGMDTASGVKIGGVTATLRHETENLADVWDEVVYERDIVWAIENGFLVEPTGIVARLDDLDLTGVTTRAGDYATNELSKIMRDKSTTTIDNIVKYTTGRRSIIFAVDVDHAALLEEELADVGIRARAVTGAMARPDREVVYAAFREGTIDAMITVMVLTEGADFPACDCVVMARPTKSRALYTQMVGRALRPYAGKEDALVIDLTGVSVDHSLMNLTRLTKEESDGFGEGSGEGEDEKKGKKPEEKKRLGIEETTGFDVIRGGDRYRWLHTPGGIPFLSDGQNITVLWEDGGQWWVGRMPMKGQKYMRWVTSNESLRMAQESAERIARQQAYNKHSLIRTKAHYHNRKPKDDKVEYGKYLGIDNADNMTKYRLDDEIIRTLVGRRVDVPVNA